MYIDSDKLKQWLVESLGYGHDNVYEEVINKVEELEKNESFLNDLAFSIALGEELSACNNLLPAKRSLYAGASQSRLEVLQKIAGKKRAKELIKIARLRRNAQQAMKNDKVIIPQEDGKCAN